MKQTGPTATREPILQCITCAVCGRDAAEAYTDRLYSGPEAFPCCSPSFCVKYPDDLAFVGRRNLTSSFGPVEVGFAACYPTILAAERVAATIPGARIMYAPRWTPVLKSYVIRPLDPMDEPHAA